MKTRILGKNGPELSVIGLGTWAIGGPWAWGWGNQPTDSSEAAIKKSIETGINWIDTAPAYGLGHAEKVIGACMSAEDKKSVLIATKCGLVWDKKKRIKINLHPDSIRAEAEASLVRLGVDQIDIYQHHWPDKNVPIEDSWGEMVRLQQEGKIKYIGVCNYNAKQLEQCTRIAPVQSLQPPLSMLKREILLQTAPYCHKNDIGIIAYSPLQTGLLTGSFDIEKLAVDDWRRYDPFFKAPIFEKIMAFVSRLKEVSSGMDRSASEAAIWWVLSQEGVTSAITGARNSQQAESNGRIGAVNFSQDQMAAIDVLLEELPHL